MGLEPSKSPTATSVLGRMRAARARCVCVRRGRALSPCCGRGGGPPAEPLPAAAGARVSLPLRVVTMTADRRDRPATSQLLHAMICLLSAAIERNGDDETIKEFLHEYYASHPNEICARASTSSSAPSIHS